VGPDRIADGAGEAGQGRFEEAGGGWAEGLAGDGDGRDAGRGRNRSVGSTPSASGREKLVSSGSRAHAHRGGVDGEEAAADTDAVADLGADRGDAADHPETQTPGASPGRRPAQQGDAAGREADLDHIARQSVGADDADDGGREAHGASVEIGDLGRQGGGDLAGQAKVGGQGLALDAVGLGPPCCAAGCAAPRRRRRSRRRWRRGPRAPRSRRSRSGRRPRRRGAAPAAKAPPRISRGSRRRMWLDDKPSDPASAITAPSRMAFRGFRCRVGCWE